MLTSVVEATTNYPVSEPSDRVLRARKQDAALRQLERTEKKAAKKVEAGQALLNEAATIRREALIAARNSGIPAQELANTLQVSVQRVYQLLSDMVSPPDDDDNSGIAEGV